MRPRSIQLGFALLFWMNASAGDDTISGTACEVMNASLIGFEETYAESPPCLAVGPVPAFRWVCFEHSVGTGCRKGDHDSQRGRRSIVYPGRQRRWANGHELHHR